MTIAIDLAKLERLESRLAAAQAAAESTRDRCTELARAAEFAQLTLFRSARPTDIRPPGRFTSTKTHRADEFAAAYTADPREVLRQFRAETPGHYLIGLMQDHQNLRDELARHQHRLREHQDEISRLNPTVHACRHYVRNLTQ